MSEVAASELASIGDAAINEGDLRLAIGAGASMDAQLPDWNTLAAYLAQAIRGSDSLQRCNVEPSWAIECVRGNGSEASYRRALRDALYGDNFVLSDTTWPFFAVRHLAAISAEIAWRAPRSQAHVITYNVDCLLELSIARLGFQAIALVPVLGETAPYREVVFEPERRPARDLPKVRILHPHGLVPVDASQLADEFEEDLRKQPLTMSAEDYEVRGGIADIWQNSLQVATFSQHRCLFYGFGFTDPSVRKLLRLAAQVRRVSGGHLAMLPSVAPGAVPNQREMCDRLEDLGVTHTYWSHRRDFQDQVAVLHSLTRNCQWGRLDFALRNHPGFRSGRAASNHG